MCAKEMKARPCAGERRSQEPVAFDPTGGGWKIPSACNSCSSPHDLERIPAFRMQIEPPVRCSSPKLPHVSLESGELSNLSSIRSPLSGADNIIIKTMAKSISELEAENKKLRIENKMLLKRHKLGGRFSERTLFRWSH